NQPAWRPELKAVEPVPGAEGSSTWKEVSQRGLALTLQTVESAPPRRLVRKLAAEPRLPFGGTWTYELAPTADGCVLTVTEHGEIYNPIVRLVSLFFSKAAAVETYLRDLARHFEER